MHSFLFCSATLATFYNNQNESNINKVLNKLRSPDKFRTLILNAVTFDKFLALQEGDLHIMFYNKSVKIQKKTLEKYHNSQFYDSLKNNPNDTTYESFYKAVNSYEQFKKAIYNEEFLLNHTHLWNVLKDVLLENKYNIILIEYNYQNENDIHLICPSNHYSDQFERYDDHKPSIIISKYHEFYEPIFFYDKYLIDFINYTHETQKFLTTISHLYKNARFCSVQPSLHDKDSEKYRYAYNTSNYIYDLLKDHKITVLLQVINTKFQNIGFIVHYSGTTIYLPVYRSAFLNNIPYVSIHDKEFKKHIRDVNTTHDILQTIYEKTNQEIPCKVTKKVVVENEIVGVYTLTNDYIQVLKNGDKDEHDLPISGLPYDVNTINETLGRAKEEILLKEENDMQKLLMNNRFYIQFKNMILNLLSSFTQREKLVQIQEIVNNYNSEYEDKSKEVVKILTTVSNEKISFTTSKMSAEEILDKNQNTLYTCQQNKNCSILHIPKRHLLNETSNEKGFYMKLADEFIRYKQLNRFFELPQQYIVNEPQHYDLHNNEILTFQSFIDPEHLQDDISEIKLFNDNFNLSYPVETRVYMNDVEESKIMENVIETEKNYIYKDS